MAVEKDFHDDTVFNCINKYFIKLNDDDVKENNVHLEKVLGIMMQKMKSNDVLFNEMYQRIVYTGSYYKGTKIEKPEEYDLNIVMKLPFNYNCIKIESGSAGYIRIRITEPKYKTNIKDEILKKLRTFLIENYLCQKKWNSWMESTITKALKTFPLNGNKRSIITVDNKQYFLHITKSGPAFTFHVKIPGKTTINIDLVSAIEFKQNIHTERLNLNCMNESWYAIPKPSSNGNSFYNIEWRFSFYEQEKIILRKNGRIKPVIKQMKKFISRWKFTNIASYYIETLCLHSIELCANNVPFTLLLIYLFRQFKQACENNYLPHYWDKKCNLFENIKRENLIDIKNFLNNMIDNIYKHKKHNPFIIAEYILNPIELEILKEKMTLQLDEPENPQPTENNSYCTIL